MLAAFVAVCVARPLVPSEAVAWLGDGHPFTMMLLVITGGYLLVASMRGQFTRSLNLVDAAVAALVLLCVTSSLFGLLNSAFEIGKNSEFDDRAASPRLAINMIWEWVGLGLVFFLARQLIATALESRALVTVMVGLAVALSALGLYQVFVTLPAEQAAYANDPDGVLMRLGEWFPEGSPERARFEDRLNSSEPVATFALANSLAGYLTPWLVVLLGVTWYGVQSGGSISGINPRRGPSYARIAGLAVCIGTILVCLVLTKSRSAYVALVVGVLLLPLVDEAFRRMLSWRVMVIAAVVLALAVGAAVASGRLDAEVLTEASKSLGYRLEYWQATLDMIAKFPVFGVGPGEFQNYYTQFKLPQASEEIRDPHNFLLEVWATGGTIAFLALAAVLGLFAWQSWELRAAAHPPDAAPADAGESRGTIGFVAAGAAAGTLFAFAIGPPFGFYLPIGQLMATLAIGAAVLAVLWPWVVSGSLPLRLPAVGVLVLAVHLLAAGGFAFPGVAGTFWILVALGLNQSDPLPNAQPVAASRWPRLVPAVALGMTIAGTVALYKTAFLPVLTSRAAMIKALDERLIDPQRLEVLVEASDADPYSSEPPTAIAQLCVKYLKKYPKADLWGMQFLMATERLKNAQPHSSAAWRQMADWYREVHTVDPNPDLATRVLQLSRGAAFLYPNSAIIQAEYARALAALDKTPAARRAAAKALELDELTPHADKKLPPEVKQEMEDLLNEPEKPAAAEIKEDA